MGRQAVMDMDGGKIEGHLPAQTGQNMQQDGRIEPPGITQAEPGTGVKTGFQEIPDLAGQVNGHGRFPQPDPRPIGEEDLPVAKRRSHQRARVSLNLP